MTARQAATITFVLVLVFWLGLLFLINELTR